MLIPTQILVQPNPQSSDSHPKCRGTFGSRKECRRIRKYNLFIDVLQHRVLNIFIFNQIGVAPKT
jgi:hypothetical protein